MFQEFLKEKYLFLFTIFSQICSFSILSSQLYVRCAVIEFMVLTVLNGINARGSGSLVIADGNTDQRTLTVPWVFGLPLSASLHYKKIGLGGYTI